VSGNRKHRISGAVRAVLYAGMTVAWVCAALIRDTPFARHEPMPRDVVAFMIGTAGTCVCIAGLEVLSAVGQQQWRDSRGRAFAGRHRIGERPPSDAERIDANSERIGKCESKIAGIYYMMSAVCDQIGVTADSGRLTGSGRPKLTVIDGGRIT
jgi:hypothetical protein